MLPINEVILCGNLGADAETRSFDNGGYATNARLATSRKGRDGQEIAQWHNLKFIGDCEVRARELKKGEMIYLNGRIEYREYNDKWYTDIIVFKWMYAGAKPETAATPAPQQAVVPAAGPPEEVNDGLPF